MYPDLRDRTYAGLNSTVAGHQLGNVEIWPGRGGVAVDVENARCTFGFTPGI
jgi:hypothetical protein